MNIIFYKFKGVFVFIKNKVIDKICMSDSLYHGNMRRYKLFKTLLGSLGEDVLIRPGIKIFFPEKINIGSHVSIQDNCYISGYGGISIGDYVSIGTCTKIVSSDHQYWGGKIIRDNPLISMPVLIGNNVWIGMDVKILGGTIIKDGTVVAAGAVVKGEIGPGVYGGIPARFLKAID